MWERYGKLPTAHKEERKEKLIEKPRAQLLLKHSGAAPAGTWGQPMLCCLTPPGLMDKWPWRTSHVMIFSPTNYILCLSKNYFSWRMTVTLCMIEIRTLFSCLKKKKKRKKNTFYCSVLLIHQKRRAIVQVRKHWGKRGGVDRKLGILHSDSEPHNDASGLQGFGLHFQLPRFV